MATEHMLERKLKNSGYYGFADLYRAHERAKAFADAVAEAGCKILCCGQPQKSKPPTWEDELPYIVACLKPLPKPVGITACCDDLGQHVIEACNPAGLRVPDEAAVIAVDNGELP
jgi:LacI family transcriptional regulator